MARILIVEARFYDDIADELLRGAHGVVEAAQASMDVLTVDGALEIPATVAIALDAAEKAGRPYDAVVALGCVIRGETTHYDYVCGESAAGIARVSLDTGVPCAFGVLTVDSMEQALARTGEGKRHQGEDAARAVLRMAALRRELSSRP